MVNFMDALLNALYLVCEQLVPIVLTVLLIMLCILINKAVKLVQSLTKTVDNLEKTINRVDTSIEKVQAPLDTAVKLSHSVDNLHDSAVESIDKAKTYINDNIDNVTVFVKEKMSTGEKSDDGK